MNEPKQLINDRYLLIKRLGEGGFAKTFEVQDKGFPKVLKVLHRKFNNHPKAVELFQREARVLSQLNHPGIPQVESDGYFKTCLGKNTELSHCIVMEKIDGQSLDSWLKHNHKLSEHRAIGWLEQLLDLLKVLHHQQLIHRDIKPSNMILRSDGKQIALIDFGGVREIVNDNLSNPMKEGTALASPGYVPPEQADGRASFKSDFFSLGRTFVHLLTGKHPSSLDRDFETGKLIWREDANEVSQSLADLLDWMMEPDQTKRPKESSDILSGLQSLKSSPQSFSAPPVKISIDSTPAPDSIDQEQSQQTQIATFLEEKTTLAVTSTSSAGKSLPNKTKPQAFYSKPRFLIIGCSSFVVAAASAFTLGNIFTSAIQNLNSSTSSSASQSPSPTPLSIPPTSVSPSPTSPSKSSTPLKPIAPTTSPSISSTPLATPTLLKANSPPLTPVSTKIIPPPLPTPKASAKVTYPSQPAGQPKAISPSTELPTSSSPIGDAIISTPPADVLSSPNGEVVCSLRSLMTISVNGSRGDWLYTNACGTRGVIHARNVTLLAATRLTNPTPALISPRRPIISKSSVPILSKKLINITPSPTPSSLPNPTVTLAPLPPETVKLPEVNTSNNPFEKVVFPQVSCGDGLPSNPAAYPLNVYPIFVNTSSKDLESIRSRTCKDALYVAKRNSILVASFTNQQVANLFKDAITKRLGNLIVRVGEPTKYKAPNVLDEKGDAPSLLKK